MAVPGLDETAFPEAQENVQCAVAQHMAIARMAGDSLYLAVLAAFVMDCSTKGKFVQDTLLVS